MIQISAYCGIQKRGPHMIKERNAAGQIVAQHGMDKTPEARVCRGAKNRCQNSNNKSYGRYGGRGIEWRFDSFLHFFETVGPRPSPKHSLDRIDNNGHYEPGNVRWSTTYEQGRNRSTNHILTFNGSKKTIAEWAIAMGIPHKTLRERIRRGWTVDRALTEKVNDVGQKKTS